MFANYSEKAQKAGGYGDHCLKNLYFDGVLCCKQNGKWTKKRQDSRKKLLYKSSHFIHNLVK